MKLTKEQIQGIVRHTLTFIGGLFIMNGLSDETIINELIGSTMSLIGLVWSIASKNK
jgi:hypothetical protein